MNKKGIKFKRNRELGFTVNRKENWDNDIESRKDRIDQYRLELFEAANTKNLSYLHNTVEHMFCQLVTEGEIEMFMCNLRKGDIKENVDKYLKIYRHLYKHGFLPYIF